LKIQTDETRKISFIFGVRAFCHLMKNKAVKFIGGPVQGYSLFF